MRSARTVGIGVVGFLWGVSLERMGFADYGELHRMFTFDSLRLLFTFMGGVAVAMLGTALLRRRVAVPRRAVHPGSAIGGLLFGVGWVLTGACPSAVGIQLGAGRLPALATLAGVVLGIWIYPRLHARFFRWDAASCGD